MDVFWMSDGSWMSAAVGANAQQELSSNLYGHWKNMT